MRWSAGARAAYAAIQRRAAQLIDPFMPYRELISALIVDTLPGDSVLGDVLRDPSVWTGSPASKVILQAGTRPGDSTPSTSPVNFVGLTFQIEDIARKEGSQVVGERHIAQVLVGAGDVQFLGLKAKELYERVRDQEIGPSLAVELGWDGLIDTNIIIQYKDFWTIDWRSVVNRPDTIFPVTLWASAALLSEIDDQQYYSRNKRVARKARTFARWLKTQVTRASDIEHGIFFNHVRLAFLTIAMGEVPPDSRHLEAAFALRDRGLRPAVVTHDALLRLRAIQAEFSVLDLPDDLLDEKD